MQSSAGRLRREPFRPRRRVTVFMPPVSQYRRARPAELNFEDLLRPQVEYLYRLAWRFTGSVADAEDLVQDVDRKSTRLNSSHSQISYAVFCLKKKKNIKSV